MNRPRSNLLALAAVAALPHLPSLFAPLFGDDYFHVEVAAALHDPRVLLRAWVLPIDSLGAWWTPPGFAVEYFRPVIALAFAFDHALFGEHAFGYHLTNLLVHVATTLLVLGIGKRVLGPGRAPWLAAGLFGIHPCHVQAVSWVSGRTDLLAGFFYAAAWLVFAGKRGARPSLRLALGSALFVVALLAKEMAITLPAVLFLGTWLARQSLGARGGGRGGETAGTEAEPMNGVSYAPAVVSGVVGAGYFAVRVALLGGFHPPPPPYAFSLHQAGLAFHLLTAPLLYLGDLTLFVPPDPMAFVPFWRAHPLAFVAFVVAVLATFAGSIKAASPRLRLFGLGWLGLTLLPVAMLTEGEHFLYVPSIGYCLLIAARVARDAPSSVSPPSRKALIATTVSVAVVALFRTGLFDAVSFASARAIEESAEALDAAPEADRLLVADLPAAAVLAYPQALRLARPSRHFTVGVLSVDPSVLGHTSRSDVTAGGAKGGSLTLGLTRLGAPFLTSYLEQALEGPARVFAEGEQVPRDGYDVTVRDVEGAQLRSFQVDVHDPARTVVLHREAQPSGKMGRLPARAFDVPAAATP